MSDKTKPHDWCQWYREEYDAGAVNPDNYRESAAFLRGLYTALDVLGKMDSEGTSAMERAISTLRAGGAMVDNLRNLKATVQVYEP